MSRANKRCICDCQPAWWGQTRLKSGSPYLADDDNDEDEVRVSSLYSLTTVVAALPLQDGNSGGRRVLQMKRGKESRDESQGQCIRSSTNPSPLIDEENSFCRGTLGFVLISKNIFFSDELQASEKNMYLHFCNCWPFLQNSSRTQKSLSPNWQIIVVLLQQQIPVSLA